MDKISKFALSAQKFLAALSAVVGVLIAQGLLDGSAASITTVLITAVGAALVYFVPNKDTEGNVINASRKEVVDAIQAEKTRVEANSQPYESEVVESSGAGLPVLDESAL